MEERKYLDGVSREIQDLLFDEQNEQAREKLLEINPNLNVNVEIHDIICRLEKANATPAPLKKQEKKSVVPGCLLMLAAPVLWGVFYGVFKTSELLDPLLPLIVLFPLILGGAGFFLYATNSNVDFVKDESASKNQDTYIPPEPSVLTTCKTCNEEISKTASSCPHCGENLPGFHFRCPKCRSPNISIGEKGYSLGKAAVGAVVLGPGGLLAGLHGRKNAELHCLSCGKKWKSKNLK